MLQRPASAGSAVHDAADTRVRAGELEKEAAQLRKDAVLLQRDVANAQSTARRAELATAELLARIEPRTLAVPRREYFGKQLSRFAMSLFGRKVALVWSPIDPEAEIFGVEIGDALRRAGIRSERPEIELSVGGPTDVGVAIRAPAKDALFVRTLVGFLRSEFPKEKISGETGPRYNASPITFTIGFKTPQGLETLPVP